MPRHARTRDTRGRTQRPRLPLWLASGVLLLAVGCRPATPPEGVQMPAPPTATQPTPLPLPRWEWLKAPEAAAANALITIADRGPVPKEAPERKAFLKVYARAFAELSDPTAPQLPVLQRLWELQSASRRARLSAGEVRRAVGLGKAPVPPPAKGLDAEQPRQDARLLSPAALDPVVRKLLQAANPGGKSYADLVDRWVRRVVIVENPAFLSGELPLTCEGSAEVLSGTVFLTARDAITGQPRPPWKVAAALVHEAEHMRWYYAVAGDDPRFVYKAPDERNAYLGMLGFVRDLRQTPAGRDAVAADSASVNGEMQKWRGFIQQANTLMGYPVDDLSPRSDLKAPDAALQTDPVEASAVQSTAGEAMPGNAQ
jgi:hypothetical protein